MKLMLPTAIGRRLTLLATLGILNSSLFAYLKRVNGTGDISVIELTSGSVEETLTLFSPVERLATTGFDCTASISISCNLGLETRAWVHWKAEVYQWGFMGPLLGSENKEAIDDYYIWDNDINFPGDDDPDTTVVIEGYNVPSGYNFVVGKGTVTVGAEGIEYPWGTGQLEHTLDSIIVYMP